MSRKIDLSALLYLLKFTLLGSMFATLAIPSNQAPIVLWTDVSLLAFIKALVWFFGLLLLLGPYLLKLIGIAEHLSEIGKISIGINISLVIIGLAALILYYVRENIILLPWVFLPILSILVVIDVFKNKAGALTSLKLPKWQLFLIGTSAIAVLIAFSVQLAQRYLIPGDVWVSLQPAVEIISQRNVYEWTEAQYPLMFGFILAGLSICSGLPVVNLYVLLFPLVALNIISFFELTKLAFKIDNWVGVIASIIYAFGGGLAWFIQIFFFQGILSSVWDLHFLTQDIYFVMPFWNTMEFSHRTLALVLGYTSIITFVTSTNLEKKSSKIIGFTISSLSILFSFLIHMLEPIILGPIIIAVAFVHQKGWKRYTSLGIMLLTTIFIALVIDFLTFGYYSWLTIIKLQLFLSTINVNKLTIFSFLALGAASAILLKHFLSNNNNFGKLFKYRKYQVIKLLIILSLTSIYFSGLFFYNINPSLELSDPFPWFMYITRYGFVGALALVGLAVIKWREKCFFIASFWGILAILVGSLWWGSRMNAYLFPVLAILAAVPIEWMWRKINIVWPQNSFSKKFKNLGLVLTIIVIVLSFTSFINGVSFYVSNGPSLDDDTVKAFAWINKNVPSNATVLVPDIYKIFMGVQTISDHKTYLSNQLPTDRERLMEAIFTYNILYALTVEHENENFILRALLPYSPLVFEAGDVKIYRLDLK